jgi:thiamine-monophosphate kinase
VDNSLKAELDDVVCLPLDKGYLVLKADMLVASTDIPPAMGMRLAARKSIVMCVSDFAAKGVQPRWALTALGLPRPITKEAVEELAEGFRQGCEEYGVRLVGGDTNEAKELVIDVCMAGLSEHPPPRRRGARPGERVVVTGPFGYPPLGLKILLEGLQVRGPLRTRAVATVLEPRARLAVGLALAKRGLVTASIDSSDGLALSLYQLAEASGVSIVVTRLPFTEELESYTQRRGLPLEELVFFGGEEFELVFTCPEERVEEALEVVRRHGGSPYLIGHVVEGSGVYRQVGGERVRVERRGWQHLAGPR